MYKKLFIVLAVIIFLALALLAVRFIFGGPEDDWICGENGWVRHGNPSAPMPEKSCGHQGIACPMDAKLCSDGSYVSRTAPDCNFTPCPKEDLIRVEIPMANAEISSPLKVKGEARGYWFFEASFPVKLYDADGNLLATGIAQAKDEWMTEDLVPFEAELVFEKPATADGTLVLQKDNPSGLPENDDSLAVPVVFQ